MSKNLTPLGDLLEKARSEVLRISVREAARRARISDTRWHQVVTGKQRKAGADVPVNPTDRTVIAMASAVGVDPGDALEAAGFIRLSDEHVAAILRETEEPKPSVADASRSLVDEIERIRNLRGVSPDDKIRMIRALVDLHEERAAATEAR
ncbi:helix-turn-helix domain-containing protein [Actinoplanes palleronii]|uniref:Uncharacterized protein n=1 Tax=Actinoplanes palleronii TaxID=113570 RepID=A0ABQ4BJD5_9ACTN|nr:helix-turn-helix domain-containing protein [Actinoplanes palleronii]GIE70787.1 hypothetical protein Apa02nite_068950 [Actinoplanes palleronii]